MAIEQTEERTGIYVRTSLRATTATDMNKLFAELAPGLNQMRNNWFDELSESVAHALNTSLFNAACTLRGSGYPEAEAHKRLTPRFQVSGLLGGGEIRETIHKAYTEPRSPSVPSNQPTPTQERDLRSLWGSCVAIGNQIADGADVGDLYEVFCAGMVYERALVREFEPVTLHGAKSKRALAAGPASKKGKAAAKYANLRRAVEGVLANEPGCKKLNAMRRVATDYRESLRTVQRAMKTTS